MASTSSSSSSSSPSSFGGGGDSSLFWNRELSKPQDLSGVPIKRTARVISLSDPEDDACKALHLLLLQQQQQQPESSCMELLQIGQRYEDFDIDRLKEQKPNVIFVSSGSARGTLSRLLTELTPSIEWVHSRSAGIDFITSPELSAFSGPVTNAKGQFSSTLAEYTLMACAYFAKDLPRLLRNKRSKEWNKYSILELRGATMGIVGFGDIGRACARLAKAYGMKVIAIRRSAGQQQQQQQKPASDDDLCHAVYPPTELNRLFAESDYIVCSAPLTEETYQMIGSDQFNAISKLNHSVFINVGRGPIVDEDVMIEALQNGQLRGAGLDVFREEPLPVHSPLWELDNVLLSPHNMDQTDTFMHESTEFFIREQLPRFVRELPLLNPVNPKNGY